MRTANLNSCKNVHDCGATTKSSVYSDGENDADASISLIAEPLLLTLNEKNQMIEKLKRQINNQKLQLEFYLKKELHTPKMYELSETCAPQAVEESIPLTIAVSRFYSVSGIKNKLHLLYERMANIDHRTNDAIDKQECILRRIIFKICDFFKPEDRIRTRNRKRIEGSLRYIELFNKLLDATSILKKELQVFRICCDRLVVIEDERNSLIDHVYSLPPEKRISCNAMFNAEFDRKQIENNLKQVQKEHEILRREINELDMMEQNILTFHKKLRSSLADNINGNCIKQMLDKINSDATALIAISQQSKEKYAKDIAHLKAENRKLREILQDVTSRSDDKAGENVMFGETSKSKHRGDGVELKKIKLQLKEMTEECNTVKRQLDETIREKEQLKHSLTRTKYNFEEIKATFASELRDLKEQNQVLNSQSTKLNVLRSTYGKILNHQMEIARREKEKDEKLNENECRLREYEGQNGILKEQVGRLKQIVQVQKAQIVQLTEKNERRETYNACLKTNKELFNFMNKDMKTAEPAQGGLKLLKNAQMIFDGALQTALEKPDPNQNVLVKCSETANNGKIQSGIREKNCTANPNKTASSENLDGTLEMEAPLKLDMKSEHAEPNSDKEVDECQMKLNWANKRFHTNKCYFDGDPNKISEMVAEA